MNVAKEGVVKVREDLYVMIAVSHNPTSIGNDTCNWTMVECDVYFICIAWCYPVIFVKDGQDIKGDITERNLTSIL